MALLCCVSKNKTSHLQLAFDPGAVDRRDEMKSQNNQCARERESVAARPSDLMSWYQNISKYTEPKRGNVKKEGKLSSAYRRSHATNWNTKQNKKKTKATISSRARETRRKWSNFIRSNAPTEGSERERKKKFKFEPLSRSFPIAQAVRSLMHFN